MRFWKMNGAGNDFLIINNMEEKLGESELPELAKTLCHRRFSVGADGLIVVDRTGTDADFRMRFYNSDGSAGEMCGNGARCICRYGYENGLAGERQTVETPSGIITGQRIDARQYRIRLTDPSVVRLGCQLEAEGKTYPCSYVELGSPGLPHAVIRMEGLREKSEEELKALGRRLRYHSTFPKGANVNFYEVQSEDVVTLITYERGVEDLTYACGTGSGATTLALTLLGEVGGQDVAVHNRGGVLFVDVERRGKDGSCLFLTGPADVVCMGEISCESKIDPS